VVFTSNSNATISVPAPKKDSSAEYSDYTDFVVRDRGTSERSKRKSV